MDNDTKPNLSKLLVSTIISPKYTKWLILVGNNSLVGREPDNKTDNFFRCKLGGTMLN